LAAAVELAGLDSLSDDDIVYLPKHKDPIQQLIEDFAGVELTSEVLQAVGISPQNAGELMRIRRMLESGDRIQARMPYLIEIK